MSTLSTLSTRTPTARAALDEHHEAWTGNRSTARRRIAQAIHDRDHATLWSACLAMLAEGDRLSPNTVTTYRAGALRFLQWADERGVNILRPEDGTGLRYRHDLMRAHANPSTINTRMAGAKVVYRALKRFRVDHENPFDGVRTVKDKRRPDTIRDAYSHRQVAALLAAAADPHDRVMVLLGSDCGLRASEMVSLTWEDVTLADRDATGAWAAAGAAIVHGKGGTVARVPLGDEVMAALERLPHREGPILARTRTPSGLRYRLNRLAAHAGAELFGIDQPRQRRAKALGLHRLRARFGTDVVMAHDLAVGQIAMRHASPNTTSRYVKHRDGVVAEFVRGLHRTA